MNHIVASFGPFLARLCTLGRLVPYAMIPDVRRLPAGEGPQGAACTATLEDQTLSLPAQHAADQTLLVRRVGAKLEGSYMHAEEYTSIYGIISEEYPWGHSIWRFADGDQRGHATSLEGRPARLHRGASHGRLLPVSTPLQQNGCITAIRSGI